MSILKIGPIAPVGDQKFPWEKIMFVVKSVAVAAIATLVSVNAFATTSDLGAIASGTTKATPASSVFAIGEEFYDTLNFSITGDNFVSIVLSSLSSPGQTRNGPFGPMTTGATGLQSFYAVLDHEYVLSSAVVGNTTTLTLNNAVLGTGAHSLAIMGQSISGGEGNYDAGSIFTSGVTAPVPEPETYAMMLAGLGALGFMVRRRRND